MNDDLILIGDAPSLSLKGAVTNTVKIIVVATADSIATTTENNSSDLRTDVSAAASPGVARIKLHSDLISAAANQAAIAATKAFKV